MMVWLAMMSAVLFMAVERQWPALAVLGTLGILWLGLILESGLAPEDR